MQSTVFQKKTEVLDQQLRGEGQPFMAHSRGVTEPNMETPALHNARLAMQVEIGGTRGGRDQQEAYKAFRYNMLG